MTIETAIAAPATHVSLIEKIARKYGVDAGRMLATLKATAFRQRGDKPISNEQMMALLVVSDQYELNPWTKEIFAFDDKGSIIPVVSVDGWARIINSHRAYDGVEFRYSDDMVTMTGCNIPAPAWCEASIYRNDRSRPTVVREYLAEVYQPPRGEKGYPGPWQSHPARMLRHKTLIQCARVAFSFAGIYDEDEAERIVARPANPAAVAGGNAEELTARLTQRAAEPVVVDVDFTEAPAEVEEPAVRIELDDELQQ